MGENLSHPKAIGKSLFNGREADEAWTLDEEDVALMLYDTTRLSRDRR